MGRALVARLRGDGVRVLATARTYDAHAQVSALDAEPLHTDLANLGEWRAETADAEVVFHLALPPLRPPLRRRAARRRASAAAEGARAVADLAAGRPVVMLSTAFAYGDRRTPAVDHDAAAGGPPAVAAAALAAEEVLAPAARVVRVPWVYGSSGLVHDVVTGLRMRRHRTVGPGDNAWALLSAEDAAAALMAAVELPPGVYSAAEEDVPTQDAVVAAVCAAIGAPRPDHVPPRFAAVLMGGAMSEALALSLDVRTGRLGGSGWAPRDDWREDIVSRRAADPPGR